MQQSKRRFYTFSVISHKSRERHYVSPALTGYARKRQADAFSLIPTQPRPPDNSR